MSSDSSGEIFETDRRTNPPDRCIRRGDRTILTYPVTFFDIHSTKAKQYGFTTILENGKKLTCAGDEPYHPACAAYVEGSDWLLHEAFCLYSQRDTFQPYEKHHSTVKDACELASSLQIPNLVLWHTEDRFSSTAGKNSIWLRDGSIMMAISLYHTIRRFFPYKI